MASSITSAPTTFDTVRRKACAATFTAFMMPRVGRHEQAEEAVVEEAGEPPRRVEEVEGVAGRRGVDHDEVEVALRWCSS